MAKRITGESVHHAVGQYLPGMMGGATGAANPAWDAMSNAARRRWDNIAEVIEQRSIARKPVFTITGPYGDGRYEVWEGTSNVGALRASFFGDTAYAEANAYVKTLTP
jgi:hypothetical protein